MHGNRSVAQYVQQWGNSASLALLDPACKIFSAPGLDGIIGYRIESKTAVVFGDPICSAADIPRLTRAFHDYCHSLNKTIVYVSASQDFTDWALAHVCKSVVGFGDEIILNPMNNPKLDKGRKASVLRNKWNQSIREGIVVKEYVGIDGNLEAAIEQVKVKWIQGRKGAQIYLYHIDLFSDRINKRWFYAEYKGTVVGVLMLNKLNAHQGWVLNIMMTTPDAPNTTSEFIVLSVLDIIRTEGCSFFTVGTTPGVGLGTIQGLSKPTIWFARYVYAIAKKVFNLGDRQRYWRKFHPSTRSLHLLFSQPSIRPGDIMAVMRALNVGSSSAKKKESIAIKTN